MKRITSLLLAALALAIATVVAVQAQETYPQQGTTAQQPSGTVEQQPTSTVDPVTAPSSELPSTASPMPFVALGGLVAMAAGAALSRLRRRA